MKVQWIKRNKCLFSYLKSMKLLHYLYKYLKCVIYIIYTLIFNSYYINPFSSPTFCWLDILWGHRSPWHLLLYTPWSPLRKGRSRGLSESSYRIPLTVRILYFRPVPACTQLSCLYHLKQHWLSVLFFRITIRSFSLTWSNVFI